MLSGGCCPSLGSLLSAMASESTLHLDSATNINLHYAHTLKVPHINSNILQYLIHVIFNFLRTFTVIFIYQHWRQRFNAKLPAVLEFGFDEAFIRIWNLYFCMCESSFAKSTINLQQLTFSRTRNDNMFLLPQVQSVVK